jgi:S-adenosylmethionine synthetase
VLVVQPLAPPSRCRAKFTVTVAKRGQFVLSIPAGVYELTGRSPMVTVNGAEMTCAATQPVRVKSGQETRGVEVICSIK